jgi:hypothetical protein
MLQNSSEFNSVGPGMGFGGFGGGIGGLGLIGLFGLRGIGDLDGHHHRHDGDGDCAGKIALLAAIGNAKDVSVAEARAIAMQICDSEKTDLQQFYAAAIQAANNTQAIQNQASAIAIVADKRFDDLALSGTVQTAAILARINQAETDRLRDELEVCRHGLRAKEVEISIQNTNTAVASQFQQQQQQQLQKDFDIHRRFDSLFNSVAIIGNQVAKSTNEIVNVGGLVAASQAANPTNVKA